MFTVTVTKALTDGKTNRRQSRTEVAIVNGIRLKPVTHSTRLQQFAYMPF